MELTVGYVTDDEKTVNKNYIALAVLDVKIKDNNNVINPTFIIATTETLNINYCYCPAWGRYYYVKVEPLTGGRIALVCRVDALMSFKNDIKNLSAIIDKQQDITQANMYLDDNSLVAENRTVVDIESFTSGFSVNGHYVLVVAGG